MNWPRFKPMSDARLMALGSLSGLVFLFVIVLRQASHDVSASVSAKPFAGPRAVAPSAPAVLDPALEDTDLLFPVPAVNALAMANSFDDARGERVHHAVDILAPRYSEVRAVADGTIARMMSSVAGGIAVYQFSDDQKLCFYYAHLQGYAPDLKEGQPVKRGQVLGYVGTTGNAPAHTPHLHFAISEVEKKNQWWGGRPLNPYPLWR